MHKGEINLLRGLFPSSTLSNKELLLQDIRKAIQHIPQPFQQILLSYYFEELDVDTIASKISLARTTVKSYKQKALDLLRRKVNPAYYEEAKRIRKEMYP